ncbi:MAG: hypothetical protein M3Q44_01100 [bacterium]|nr:hypothetical protein [bacterium]
MKIAYLKIKTTLFITLIISCLQPQAVYAQLGTLAPPPAANVKLGEIVVTMVNYLIGSGVLVFFLLFVWGCLEWITSQGDKGSLAKARGRITNAAIGLAILASVWAVYFLVKAITYNTA